MLKVYVIFRGVCQKCTFDDKGGGGPNLEKAMASFMNGFLTHSPSLTSL